MSYVERAEGSLTLLTPEEGVVFTGRTGGVSRGRFESLNLSERVGDSIEAVEENRRRVAVATDTGPQWAMARQVHGNHVVAASQCGQGIDADAVVVTPGDGVAAVLTADCVPIAIRGPGSAVAVHAGWRGIVAGVVERALDSIDASHGVRAWIGPCIGPCHYEVGRDVADLLTSAVPGERDIVFERDGSLWADLPGAVVSILRSRGVAVGEQTPPCTYCDHRFYSYRRDGQTGRQALLVWM